MSSSQIAVIVAVVIAAVYLDWLLIKWQQKNQEKFIIPKFTEIRIVEFSKLFSNFLAWLKNRNFEVLLMALWAIWVGHVYLNFDKNIPFWSLIPTLVALAGTIILFFLAHRKKWV